VSTFYLLPPRPILGQRFADYLELYFPRLLWPQASWSELGDALGAAIACHPDVYVVYREDLPADEDKQRALSEIFGAAEGDEVIEVKSSHRTGELTSKRWRMGALV